jgi:hypothetical protein
MKRLYHPIESPIYPIRDVINLVEDMFLGSVSILL